jgi:hypothetical protein
MSHAAVAEELVAALVRAGVTPRGGGGGAQQGK